MDGCQNPRKDGAAKKVGMALAFISAAPCSRTLGGKPWLGGKPCQGRQPPEAGAAGPPLQGLPPSHTRPPRSTADPRDAASSAIYARIHAAGNSATSCAAIAATTRTPNPSLLPIGSSGDCDAENASLRTCRFGLVALPPLQRPTGHRRARVGGPRLTIKGKEIGRWRGPPLRLRALAHPPAHKAHYGSVSLSIGLELGLYGHRLVAGILFPLMALWNATNGGGGRTHSGRCVNVAVGVRP